MKAHLLQWSLTTGWSRPPADEGPTAPSLVLCFAGRALLAGGAASPLRELEALHPGAVVAHCSTAGEICGSSVTEGGASALVLSFRSTQVEGAIVPVAHAAQSEAAGRDLAQRLSARPGLRHVLVLSDGLGINGTQLAAGLRAELPEGVAASGGLAGDGSHFRQTLVGLGSDIGPGRVVGIGFYGKDFCVSCGSAGGWMPFGPRRLVTRSEGNILFELDGQPALALYKRYLGERASGLPATGLLFPLQLLPSSEREAALVRTILAIDEKAQSLTFAGDLPQGRFVRLMKAGGDALVNGAAEAADYALKPAVPGTRAVVLVSCVGRRLVLGQRVEEEVEAVLARLGTDVVCAGFYSYGELCPSSAERDCELHNQTMTLTVMGETSEA